MIAVHAYRSIGDRKGESALGYRDCEQENHPAPEWRWLHVVAFVLRASSRW
jgi:hypothetical protein